jgi:hypothetical protein
MGALRTDGLEPDELRDVRPGGCLQAGILGEQRDDALRWGGCFPIVDVLDAREGGDDLLQRFDGALTALEGNPKSFRVSEQDGLVLIKLKVWDEADVVDVLPEDPFQCNRMGSRIVRI